jgi:inhibitor of KinA sporulation pathway (predicted exonuclease)
MSPVRDNQRSVLESARLLVVDVECTCGPGVTEDIRDIIEFGSLVLELNVPPALEHASSMYVRPERSAVNSFCTRLTGITPERLTNEPNFVRCAPCIRAMILDARVDSWATWGEDQTLVHRQCVASGVANPFEGLLHVDLKRLMTPLVYQLTGGEKPKGAGAGVGLSTALRELGLGFIGRQHGGAADAFNTARVLQELRRRAAPHLARTVESPVRRRRRPGP